MSRNFPVSVIVGVAESTFGWTLTLLAALLAALQLVEWHYGGGLLSGDLLMSVVCSLTLGIVFHPYNFLAAGLIGLCWYVPLRVETFRSRLVGLLIAAATLILWVYLQ